MSAPTINLKFDEESSVKTSKLNGGLFINGEFVASQSGETIKVVNPSTEEVIGEVAAANEKDVDIAVEAAQKAYDTVWGVRCPGSERAKLLLKLALAIEANADELAAIESADNGKAFAIAKGFDVAEAAACLRYYGGWADKIHGKTIEVNDSKLVYTRHEPIGVIGQIIPWNFPLLMLSWKLGPALACGNTIVIKTAEQTPLSALKIAELAKDIFPPGVINIITGYGAVAGAAIASHMNIEKVAFTGSTLVGRSIMKAAAQSNLKKVTLELGGKSPNIIFDDANLEDAVKWSSFGLFFNHGQCCCAGSRIFVQASIYDKFMEAFKKQVQTIKVGNPYSADTFQGPQVSKVQYDRVMAYIKSGKEEGATVTLGGNRYGEKGYFIEPTIFTDVKEGTRIRNEEIFGPVVVVIKFDDEKDLIRMANDTVYGLAAAVFSRDISRALDTAHKLQAGTVWVNCYNQLHNNVPFGGYKQSGIGRELGEYALSNYTNIKSVHVNLSGPAP